MTANVALVGLPFAPLYNPSIQLGILAALLDQAQITSRTFCFNLELLRYCYEHDVALAPADYDAIIKHAAAGTADLAIAAPHSGLDQLPPAAERLLLDNGVPEEVVTTVSSLHSTASAFVVACADAVLSECPHIVAMTTGFSQLVPAVALSIELKRREPSITTILGGADCDHEMGEAILRKFSCIDIIVRGEAESVFIPLVKSLLGQENGESYPGVCYRHGEDIVVNDELTAHVNMDDVPTPLYDEYFATLQRNPFHADIRRLVEMPIETSRGCWWGEKHHCTFCGISDFALQYRRSSSDRVVREIRQQMRKHRLTSFMATDAIADMKMFQTLFPTLADGMADLSLFFEVKANLKQHQLRLLRDAGVRHIQPGIESLSSEILRSIRKGTTAFHNVRLLKWARQLGMNVLWNIVYGFPEEPPKAYRDMARIAKAISHLQPPALVPLILDRFSPYFQEPSRYKLTVTGPPEHLRFAFPGLTPDDYMEFAYRFRFSYDDGRIPEEYVEQLRSVVEHWCQRFDFNRISLRISYGEDFVVIHDSRPFFQGGSYYIEGLEAQILVAAENGSALSSLTKRLVDRYQESTVSSAIDTLSEHRLLLVLDDHCLSLPLRSRTQYASFVNNV